MSDDFIGFGMGDEKLSTRDLEYYKGKNGVTDRISLCWLNLDGNGKPIIADPANPDPRITPKFKSYLSHYVPGLGYIAPVDPYTTERFGAAKPQVITFIVKYQTDKSGQIQGELDPSKVTVMPWKLSIDKYNRLKTTHAEFNLTCTDLRTSCKEEKFQNIDFFTCNGRAMWQRNKEVAAFVLSEVRRYESQLRPPRQMTIDQIKEKLGEDTGPAPAAVSESSFDELMNGLE